MERGIRLFLEGLGEAVSSRDLRQTPRLVAKAFDEELLSGYASGTLPRLSPLAEAPPDAMVVVRGIRFVSVCRHHLLPFQGVASVAYLPGRKLAGFSSVARLVEALARRLQIQEELSEQILDSMEKALAPRGCACLLEATHQCMTCRGANQSSSRVATLRLRGLFEKNGGRRREVVALLHPSVNGRRFSR
jgi:GTP cyclohydrolase I